MRHLLAASLVVAVLLLLAGCSGPDHEQLGDQAAAASNWRAAEQYYRTAMGEKPDLLPLRQKHADARTRALEAARAAAEAAYSAGHLEKALEEIGYVTQMEPSDGAAAASKAHIARELALRRVEQANGAVQVADFERARQLLGDASKLSTDKEVTDKVEQAGIALRAAEAWHNLSLAEKAVSEKNFEGAYAYIKAAQGLANDPQTSKAANDARKALAEPAMSEANRLASAKDYDKAVKIANIAAEIDPAYKGLADALAREGAGHKLSQAQQYEADGKAALLARKWADAERAFADSLAQKDDPRVKKLADYARLCGAAAESIGARKWSDATTSLEAAVAVGVETDVAAWATDELSKVRVRDVAFRVSAILVSPIAASGKPFAGENSPGLKGHAQSLVAAAKPLLDGDLEAARRRITQAAAKIDASNQPDVRVKITLPDGRIAAAATQGVWYAGDDIVVVIASNHYDERKLGFELFAAEIGRNPIGSTSFKLGEIVASQVRTWGDGRTLIALRIEAETPDRMTQTDGSLGGTLTVVAEPGNRATSHSQAMPGSRGWRLDSANVALGIADFPTRASGATGTRAPYIVIEQNGAEVARTNPLTGKVSGQWDAIRAMLFVRDDEKLVLLVRDAGEGEGTGDDLHRAELTAAQIAGGRVQVETPRGGTITLSFSARNSTPE